MPLQIPDARDGWRNAVMFVEEEKEEEGQEELYYFREGLLELGNIWR
jgi:hypothetical protein